MKDALPKVGKALQILLEVSWKPVFLKIGTDSEPKAQKDHSKLNVVNLAF